MSQPPDPPQAHRALRAPRSTITDATRRDARAYLGLVGLAAAIGIPAAALAALFLALVHWLEDLLWTDLPDALGHDEAPWYLVVGLPVAGGFVVWLARRFLPGDGGHAPLGGLSTQPTPWQYAPGIALAALGTLAFGAVLGPEAPLIALGSAVGMALQHHVRLGRQGQAVLSSAGSFSAISALFGGPLVAGVLLLEAGVAAGAALISALLPGLVAAAVGYVLFVGLGDWGGLDTAGLVVPGLPNYEGTHLLDLLLAIVVGVLAAVLMAQVHLLGSRVDRLASGRRRMLVALVAGGLVVGVLAQVTSALGGDSDEILFSGQAALPQVVEESAGLLVLILVAKAVGYAVCLGCGFRGGPVFPAIFLGVTIATFAVAVFDTSVTWAVAAGAAAGMTAGTGLLFSSLLFSMLLVGHAGQDALPAAVFAAAAAWLARAALTGKVPGRPPQPATAGA